jgi:hypothetical protein
LANQREAFQKLAKKPEYYVNLLIKEIDNNLSDPIPTLLLEICGQDHFPGEFDQDLFEDIEQYAVKSWDAFKSNLVFGIREVARSRNNLLD